MAKRTTRLTVHTECESCSGTGLYGGMCEAEGTAVICLTCGGSGDHELEYKPYQGRKRYRGIKSIQPSRGMFLTGAMGGGDLPKMTYKEFEAKFPAVRYRA